MALYSSGCEESHPATFVLAGSNWSSRGVFFYLYLFMDIFSRKIVGWQIYESESSEQASEVLKDLCWREGIGKNWLSFRPCWIRSIQAST